MGSWPWAALKTCKRGHRYTEANTYRSVQGLQCRACRAFKQSERRAAEKAARPVTRTEVEAAVLTERQWRSLDDALADGIPAADVAGRFGVNVKVVLSRRAA